MPQFMQYEGLPRDPNLGLPRSARIPDAFKMWAATAPRYRERWRWAVVYGMAPLQWPVPMQLTYEKFIELTYLNAMINVRMRWVPDPMQSYFDFDKDEIVNVQDQWGKWPNDRGDCDDFALRKRQELLKLGWDPAALHPVVGTVPEGGHMILCVTTNQGDYFLDNRVDSVYGVGSSEAETMQALWGPSGLQLMGISRRRMRAAA